MSYPVAYHAASVWSGRIYSSASGILVLGSASFPRLSAVKPQRDSMESDAIINIRQPKDSLHTQLGGWVGAAAL